MILFIYNSVKCKLIYSDRKQVSGCPRTGFGERGVAKGHKEMFEMMKIFVILIVMIVFTCFRYTSELFIVLFIVYCMYIRKEK